jgi:hypothetical protein
MNESTVEFDPPVREPPILTFIREYWEARRGAAPMPRRQDVAPADMKSYLPNIMLADVVQGGEDFRYRVVGSHLQRYFRGNPTGMLMSAALAAFGRETVNRTIAVYRMVMTHQRPVRVRGPGTLYSQQAKLFDALLTPLSDDGVQVNMILGTFVFEWEFTVPPLGVAIMEPDERELANALLVTN